MRCELICNYCGHHFIEFYYSPDQLEHERCPVCKDKNLKVKQADSGDYFGYEKKTTKDAYIKKK